MKENFTYSFEKYLMLSLGSRAGSSSGLYVFKCWIRTRIYQTVPFIEKRVRTPGLLPERQACKGAVQPSRGPLAPAAPAHSHT